MGTRRACRAVQRAMDLAPGGDRGRLAAAPRDFQTNRRRPSPQGLAGFLHIGRPAERPPDRPRPDLRRVATRRTVPG